MEGFSIVDPFNLKSPTQKQGEAISGIDFYRLNQLDRNYRVYRQEETGLQDHMLVGHSYHGALHLQDFVVIILEGDFGGLVFQIVNENSPLQQELPFSFQVFINKHFIYGKF
jgi:hypothetical protein